MPPAGGYAWWYVDGISDDGEYGISLIAFIGSVFSPYYAWARRRGGANPLNHCALNVALYSQRRHRWAMTERGAGRVHNEFTTLSIGASLMRWTGHSLEVTIDETCSPIPRRLQGMVRLFPRNLCERRFDLDAAGRHRWQPYAPCSRIEVSLAQPRLDWRGSGYFDANFGTEPLESAFRRWHWSRSIGAEQCLMLYDVEPRERPARSLALAVHSNGAWEQIEPPPLARLRASRWQVSRVTRADAAHPPLIRKTFEDAPFYSRTLLQTRALGLTMPAIHESLDLDRFRSAWVQCLLPFRMPRTR